MKVSLRNHLKNISPHLQNVFQNNGSVKFINCTASLLGCLPFNGISDCAEADAGLHLNLMLIGYVMSFLNHIWSTAGFTTAIMNIDSRIICGCFCLFSCFSFTFLDFSLVFFLRYNINENTWFFFLICILHCEHLMLNIVSKKFGGPITLIRISK